MTPALLGLAFLLGLLLALAVSWLGPLRRARLERNALQAEVAGLKEERARLQAERDALARQVGWREQAEGHLRDLIRATAQEALQGNAQAFLREAQARLDALAQALQGNLGTHREQVKALVDPLREDLERLNRQVQDLERRREGTYQSLGERLDLLLEAYHRLQDTTASLNSALKASPTVRGRWGEIQLRRVVELAGLLPYVEFREQVSTDEGRPDLVVHLPNGGVLPVDAKVPLQGYLDALDRPDPEAQREALRNYAKDLRRQVRELARRAYWKQFPGSPEMVVMFVPLEACLASALEHAPDLLEEALQSRVLLATPITLIAILLGVADLWKQHRVQENAREVARLAQEFHHRVRTFLKHLEGVRNALDRAVSAYNEAVDSLESQVLPTGRRLRHLGVSGEDLPSPPPIERAVRPLPPYQEAEDGR